MPRLSLYSKPGCHLCEGLEEKLRQVQGATDPALALDFELEIRDITTQPDWYERYQYEIPVLCWQRGEAERPLPRLAPRASLKQVAETLRRGLA